jgi:hypothetical protein
MNRVQTTRCLNTLAAFCLSSGLTAFAATPAADLLVELIRADTSNPPGKTAQLDKLMQAKLTPANPT